MFETLTTTLTSWLESDAVGISALIASVVTFFTGENGAIFIFAFTLGGYLPIPVALVAVFLGSFAADMFWYSVTVGALRPWFDKRIQKYERAATTVQGLPIMKLAERHPYTVLTLIKFLVGIRLMLTIYIASRRDIPIQKYVACNFLANILFVGAIFSISALLHAGFGGAVEIKDGLTKALTLVVLIGIGGQVILRGAQVLIARFILRKEKPGAGEQS